ncbi:MAG: hypothetical protein WBF79_18405 [Rhodococcus sp. (in: high G+C Gram-positive bacteria)]
MIVLAIVALVVCGAAPSIPAASVPTSSAPRSSRRSTPRSRTPWWLPAVVTVAALAAAALAAVAAREPVTGVALVVVLVLVVLVALAGGTVVAPAAFHLARRRPERADPDTDDSADNAHPTLRGGLVIGALERVAVVVSVLAGWPEGIAVVLAVKGLARYPELRDPRASEYFIIGTFTSVLWALGAGGVGIALIR